MEESTPLEKKEGVRHQFTVPKTPQQNGVAERMNRTLMEMVRSMLSDSKLQKNFWAEALLTAAYLRNRSPTTAVEGKTPFEAWTEEKPNVSHLKTFGCVCYAHILSDERQKLDAKARKCLMLGYGTETKAYRLYDIEREKIIFSRDVITTQNEQETRTVELDCSSEGDDSSHEVDHTECLSEDDEP